MRRRAPRARTARTRGRRGIDRCRCASLLPLSVLFAFAFALALVLVLSVVVLVSVLVLVLAVLVLLAFLLLALVFRLALVLGFAFVLGLALLALGRRALVLLLALVALAAALAGRRGLALGRELLHRLLVPVVLDLAEVIGVGLRLVVLLLARQFGDAVDPRGAAGGLVVLVLDAAAHRGEPALRVVGGLPALLLALVALLLIGLRDESWSRHQRRREDEVLPSPHGFLLRAGPVGRAARGYSSRRSLAPPASTTRRPGSPCGRFSSSSDSISQPPPSAL